METNDQNYIELDADEIALGLISVRCGKKGVVGYLSDGELMQILDDFDDLPYTSLPQWIQQELQARRLTFNPRQPTQKEINETTIEAKELRKLENKETIDDLYDKYIGNGKEK